MLTIREVIKTLYNALLQRIKKYRGNWDQNDSSADDYIKNRPFYEDDTKKETIVKSTNFTTYEDYEWCSPFIFEPTIGRSYEIIFDGKVYKCEAYLFDGCICLGNAAVWGVKPTEDPFFYFYYDEEDYGLAIQFAGPHNIEITQPLIVKLDEKFLPSGIARQDDIDNLMENVVIRSDFSQDLTDSQKAQARTNIGLNILDVVDKTVVYEWDGNTTSRDSFIYNAFPYYKISEEIYLFETVLSAISTGNNGYQITNLINGQNCYKIGNFMIVNSPGACAVKVNTTSTEATEFTAPSTGVYAFKRDDTGSYGSRLELNLHIEAIKEAFVNNKVDKIEGKNLSTNDYTNEEKEKLSSVEAGAQANVQPNWDVIDESDPAFIKNKTHYYEEPTTIKTTSYGSSGSFSYYTLYKVADVFLTPNDILGGKIICNNKEYEITSDLIAASYSFDASEPYYIYHPVNKDSMPDYSVLFFVPPYYSTGKFKGYSYNFPMSSTGGIYVMAGACSSLQYGGALKKLDEIFIPDTIARKDDLAVITESEIDAICGNTNVETWQFTMTDGSITEKQVVVSE